MSFEADLKSHLTFSAVTDLIGERLTPVIRDEESDGGVDGDGLPAATYQIIAADQVNNLAGRDGSLRNYRVQLDIWSRTHSDMLLIDAAIRSRMDTAATSFRSAMLPSGFDGYEPDTRLYRRMLEFSCWHRET